MVHSKIRSPPVDDDTIQLSATTAFNVCDGLFKMASCLITELPVAQLREVRYDLETLVTKVDRLLGPGEDDLSLSFGELSVDPDIPGSEDFGPIMTSTSLTANVTGLASLPSPPRRPRQNTIRTPVPATPAPTPTPTPAPVPYHGRFPYIISTREHVGLPDYTYHPHFIRPGVPGPYQHPPTASGLSSGKPYHVVTKGLYVGIFDSWDEVSPWVLGVSGSLYRRCNTWNEARDAYNARVHSVVQILS